MVNKKFNTVTRYRCKASIMIEGLSGQGKSGLALAIAQGLQKNDLSNTYVIDTENRSIDLFQGLPSSSGGTFDNFKKVDLTDTDGFAPSNYLELRQEAINEGAEVVINDSISHAWQYQGGILTMVNEYATNSNKNDKYAAWRDPKISEEKNLLLALLRCDKCHIITTVRIKEKFAPETDETGKTKIVSLGEQQIMQDDMKYEPDLVLHMERAGNGITNPVQYPIVTVMKSRYPMFQKDEVYEMTPDLIESLRKYLDDGADPNQLLEQQRLDYIQGVKDYIKNNPNKKTVWNLLKQNYNYENTKIDQIPLDILKKLFSQLTV